MTLLSVVCVLPSPSRHIAAGGQLARIVIAGLLALQFVLGIGDVLLLAPIWMQILHLLGADLYWIALVLLTSTLFWPINRIAALPSSNTR